jgi:transcriptional regulator with XRE-family HTH domain
VPSNQRPRRAISDAHARLGSALRRTRLQAGVSTRRLPKIDGSGTYFSSGHVSLVEAGATPPSAELVEAYAALGNRAELMSLHLQMLAESQHAARTRRQGTREGTGAGAPKSMREVRDRRDVQRHYIVVSNHAEYLYGPAGAIREVRCTIALRARTAGVRLYYAGHSYPSDQRTGVVEVLPVAHTSIAESQESPSGAVATYFLLDDDISPDDPEPYILQFTVLIHSDIRSVPRLRYFATEGTQQLILRAVFPESVLPARVWWFAQQDPVAVEQAIAEHEVRLGADGGADHVFDDLIPGWCYGFAWEWPQDRASHACGKE